MTVRRCSFILENYNDKAAGAFRPGGFVICANIQLLAAKKREPTMRAQPARAMGVSA